MQRVSKDEKIDLNGFFAFFLSLSREMKGKMRDILVLLHGNFLVITACTSCVLPWMNIFSPYESVYMRLLGASSLIIGFFFAANRLIGVVTNIPGGYLCDMFGRKKIIVVGNSLAALIRFFVALSTNWELYFTSRLLLSLTSFWNIAESIILMDSMKIEKRGLSFSVYWTFTQLASLSSPYIGGLLLESRQAEGLRLILFLIAVADAVKSLVYAKFLEETLKPVKMEKKTLSISSLLTPFVETFKTLKYISRPVLGFCFLSVINGFSWAMISPFVVLYAFDVISLSPVEWGIISTIERVVILSFRIPGGIISDRYSKRRLLLFASIGNLGYFIVFIFSRSFLPILLATIVKRVILTLADPAWPALQADLISKRQRGKVLSLLNVLGAPSGFVGSIIGGYLYEVNPVFLFLIFLICNISNSLIIYHFIHEPEKPEE